MEFMGIKNVVDMEAILGADGVADGFKVTYNEPEEVVLRNGKKFVRDHLKMKTVWVREFDYESVGSDGVLHGFGNGIMIKRVASKKDTAAKGKGKKMNAAGLAAVTKILAGK